MRIAQNYVEPCVCGDPLDKIAVDRIWRIISWKCPACGRDLAQTVLSDSPCAAYYAEKTLRMRSNAGLREQKNLPPKPTRVSFYTDDNRKILWSDIVKKNKAWEKRVGAIQRKPF